MRNRSSTAVTAFMAILVSLQFLSLSAGIAGILAVDALRSYVAGEGTYSKAGKRAALLLRRYAVSGHGSDYVLFQSALEVPQSAALARIILERPEFPFSLSYERLEAAGIAPDSPWSAALMFRLLSETRLFGPAIETWRKADREIEALEDLGTEIHAHWLGGILTPETQVRFLARIDRIDAELSVSQARFSSQIGEGARVVRTGAMYGMTAVTLALVAIGFAYGVVTSRRLGSMERVLRERQRRFRDLARSAGDWFWETDDRFRLTYVSERLQEVVGASARMFPEQASLGFGNGDDSRAWRQHLEDLEARRPFGDFEYSFLTVSGEEKRLRISGRPVFDEHGRFVGYRGAGTDITEIYRAQRDAERRRELLEITFETMAEGIITLDGTNRVLAVNRRFHELLGLPEGTIEPGDALHDLPDAVAVDGEQERVWAPGGQLAAVVAATTEGQQEWIRGDGAVIRLRGKTRSDGRVVVTCADVTESKRTECDLFLAKEEAVEANRVKSLFLANMSHELRTPLNAIIGFSGMMTAGLFGPMNERYREYAQDIQESGLHLLQIINDILDVSRVEMGKLSLNPEPIQPVAVVKSCIRIVETRAREAGIKIVSEVPPDAPGFRADAQRLRQILLNLLGNAVKFSPRGSVVRVRYAASDEDVIITVEDSGIGMTEQECREVLEPFAQADSSLSRSRDGVGLGLTLVKGFAELHGGSVRIDSAKGRGTTVSVIFPKGVPAAQATCLAELG